MAKWHHDHKGRKIGWWYTLAVDSDGNEVIRATKSDALAEEVARFRQRQSESRIHNDVPPTDYETQIRDARYSRPLIVRTQTPPWADFDAIKEIYRKCRRKTKRGGKISNGKRKGKPNKVYTVDHIIPLRGKRVSGLHCEDNLQIILRTDNQKKSNKFHQ